MIKLVDARRGLKEKCEELFHDEKIARYIYDYLCDGIDECDIVNIEREIGRWETNKAYPNLVYCSSCGVPFRKRSDLEPMNYCPYCGTYMRGSNDEQIH